MRDHRHRAILLLIGALVAGCNAAPEGPPSDNAPAQTAEAAPPAKSSRASRSAKKLTKTAGPRPTKGFVD